MFETVSVGMMNLFTAPDLTYMNGKTDDMECHVKDKFSKEVLLYVAHLVTLSPSLLQRCWSLRD